MKAEKPILGDSGQGHNFYILENCENSNFTELGRNVWFKLNVFNVFNLFIIKFTSCRSSFSLFSLIPLE